jgi:TPR repeat protein
MKNSVILFILLCLWINLQAQLPRGWMTSNGMNAELLGDKVAEYNLGLAYYNGIGSDADIFSANYVSQDYTKAIHWFSRSAEHGCAPSQCNLGYFYYKGEGVEQDYEQAVYWYRKSVEQEHSGSQNNLGLCYANGEGVEKNLSMAKKLLQQAAEQGLEEAKYNLNVLETGEGKFIVAEWFSDKIAQYYLGLGYFNKNNNVEQDYTQRVYWYRKSAEQGYEKAQYNLGHCYYFGRGVTQDYKQAVFWYHKSADQGYEWAQYYLGICYANGEGVVRDLVMARKLWQQAAAQRMEEAEDSLDILEKGQGELKTLKFEKPEIIF